MGTSAGSIKHDSWSEVLDARRPSSPWLVVPSDPSRGADHKSISSSDLQSLARRIARALRVLGGRHGDKVIVVADNSVESSLLLVATLISGLVAVPVAPPSLGMRKEIWAGRVHGVAADCGARLLVGRIAAYPGWTPPPNLRVYTVAALLEASSAAEPLPLISPDRLALIQYTSGTTGTPRGVELTHANTLQNVDAIGGAIGVTPQDVGLTWLPLFHDMGLIGGLLFATYWSIPLVLLTPSKFLARPESWLWAISRFRVTCSAAPNYAYQASSNVTAPRASGLDLSSWRVAFNGSELVQSSTMEAFARRFGPYGFRSSAMYPVYGLAENTVAAALPVCGIEPRVDWIDRSAIETAREAKPRDRELGARGVARVGSALPDQELRIAVPHSAPGTSATMSERTVGEIEVRGPSVMRGYHRAPELTASVLSADRWLRTGDLGYMVDGELYVVGRCKEVISRAGRKFDAADVREAVRHVSGIRAGFTASFGVPNEASGTEDLVILAETALRTPGERAQLESAIAAALLDMLAIRPDVVRLLEPGALPRTTSGKVQQGLARDLYLSRTHSKSSSIAANTHG